MPLVKVTVAPAPMVSEARVWLTLPNFMAPALALTIEVPVPSRPFTLVVPPAFVRVRTFVDAPFKLRMPVPVLVSVLPTPVRVPEMVSRFAEVTSTVAPLVPTVTERFTPRFTAAPMFWRVPPLIARVLVKDSSPRLALVLMLRVPLSIEV